VSLVDGDHIVGARERHGAHYFTQVRKHDGKHVPSMRMRMSSPDPKDNICQNCFRTPLDPDAKTCVRCGGPIGPP